MIQYNNFLMKREQSRAGSRFAECEKSRLKAKILITLALLLTAVTGAWAQEETLLTTVTATGHTNYSQSPDGIVTVTLNKIDSYHYLYGWLGGGSVTVEAAQGYTITRCVFKQNPNGTPNRVLVDDQAPFTATIVPNLDGGNDVSAATTHGDVIGDDFMNGISYIEVYGTNEPPIEVKPVEGKTNEWTFSMPGSDVVLTPQYAPAAKWATEGDAVLAPTAIEGIIAGTTDAIVKAGTVVEGQGTVMYFATTEQLTAAQAAQANGWLSTLPTAANIADDGATVYVWYYIKGTDTPDGQEATAENTFNDSEICAQPLEVIVLSNKFDITFNAANANTIEAGKATVKVGETAAEVKEGKLTGVKMGTKVTLTAKQGYKFRKVEVKKGGGEPVLLTTITAADNSSFKSGSQTFGDVATVTLTGDYLINDGSHGGWYCQGSNKTATISVAAANGANITSVKFYTAGGGSAEDKDAPFEVTTTTVTSSNITTYLNGNSIGSYGVSKIEVYGTK